MSILTASRPGRPAARYYCRVRNDDFITRFVVLDWLADPRQHVYSEAPDGTMQPWRRREEEGKLVFLPPDGYRGGGVQWCYDPKLQVGQRVPTPSLESELLANRRSVIVQGLRG